MFLGLEVILLAEEWSYDATSARNLSSTSSTFTLAISILHKHMWPYSSEVGTGREIPQRKNTATSMLSVKPGSKPGQLSLTRLL